MAKSQGVANLAAFLPLFLTGGAFTVYQQFSEDDKKDYERVKLLLLRAFAVDQFAAYEILKDRKLKFGESVDVYLADVRGLIALICKNTQLEDSKELIKTAFVAGLPYDIKCQMKASCSMQSTSLEGLVERVRNLTRCNLQQNEVGCASKLTGKKENGDRSCFVCNSQSHLKKDCPKLNQGSTKRCYLCNSPSHLLPQCPKKYDGRNGQHVPNSQKNE